MRFAARPIVSIAVLLLTAFASISAGAARCSGCARAPCCKAEPSDEARVLPHMPCCKTAKAGQLVAPHAVTFDELLPLTLPRRFAYVAPALSRASADGAPDSARRAPPLYQKKCALLL